MQKRVNKPLTKEQAQNLHYPTLIWMEECGGFEGTRYAAEAVRIVDMNDDYVSLHGPYDHPWSGGRTWDTYNRSVCGWRFWRREPTHEERMSAKWDEWMG